MTVILDKNFNVEFRGSYSLLKWIIAKYKKELPYNGLILNFIHQIHYTRNVCANWEAYGVPSRVWNSVHKDLIMANLMQRIKDEDVKDLEQLKEEFEEKHKEIDSAAKTDIDLDGKKSYEYRAWLRFLNKDLLDDDWMDSFAAFKEEIGTRPSQYHKLTRIDTSDKLSADNYTWRMSYKLISINKEEKPLQHWLKSLNVPHHKYYTRIKNGMTEQKALLCEN